MRECNTTEVVAVKDFQRLWGDGVRLTTDEHVGLQICKVIMFGGAELFDFKTDFEKEGFGEPKAVLVRFV